MHGSSLYVYASVYRCICMDQVYMYVRVFIGVYAWIKFICILNHTTVARHPRTAFPINHCTNHTTVTNHTLH